MFSWVDFDQSSEEGKSFMPDLKAKFERKAAEEDDGVKVNTGNNKDDERGGEDVAVYVGEWG